MADLFSPEWMESFQAVWNSEPGLADDLSKIDFTSTIAYGFLGDDAPAGVLVVENGQALSARHQSRHELYRVQRRQ